MAALAGALTVGGVASAQTGFLYGGMHPINPMAGSGFCYTNAAHDHPYPTDPNVGYLYRNVSGYQYFVGNPYHFGYQGQAWQEILSADASQRLLLSPTRIYDPVTGRFLSRDPLAPAFCDACFTGDYPISLDDQLGVEDRQLSLLAEPA